MNELVIVDKEEKHKYPIDGIRNKIISGDAFKVLKKIDDEMFDMIFIDPPYFPLKRVILTSTMEEDFYGN